MKYEHVNREKISNDIFTDVLATKTNYDKQALRLIPNSSCTGFIQEISMVPYGMLLISDLQVIFNLNITAMRFYVVFFNRNK